MQPGRAENAKWGGLRPGGYCLSYLRGKMLSEQGGGAADPIIDTAVMVFVNVTHKMLKEETLATHRAVVDSIIDRDPIGARTAMTMHMTYNRNLIRKLWKESQK